MREEDLGVPLGRDAPSDENSIAERVALAIGSIDVGRGTSLFEIIEWWLYGPECARALNHDALTIEGETEKVLAGAARAAIEAMREPTPRMVEAGRQQIAYHIRPIDNVSPTWAFMIDAALSPSPIAAPAVRSAAKSPLAGITHEQEGYKGEKE